jgi:hypothetical protein
MAKPVAGGAGRQDQSVVGKQASVTNLHSASDRIDAGNLAHYYANVPVSRKDGADGKADISGRQGGGCNLIQQRLEQMMVGAVDQRDLGGGAGQPLCSLEPTETGAYDDDARRRRRGIRLHSLKTRRAQEGCTASVVNISQQLPLLAA